ncbi:hypothetical protein Poly41_46820 [Novipirellula artificiosorum]|uniref:Uncharacterized protein n=1 Tax=Novipirellula artificiosorum TaxID=2528016 RepID=A0A5C6DEY0_9BACT|nr:hypothetical protein Poly41_46820 [Novipirellula artificiosorum]
MDEPLPRSAERVFEHRQRHSKSPIPSAKFSVVFTHLFVRGAKTLGFEGPEGSRPIPLKLVAERREPSGLILIFYLDNALAPLRIPEPNRLCL